MILIFCPSCKVLQSLSSKRMVVCDCGASWGTYDTPETVKIAGRAVPVGIANDSLLRAVARRPATGLGAAVDALVLPLKTDFVRIDHEASINKIQEKLDEPAGYEDAQ